MRLVTPSRSSATVESGGNSEIAKAVAAGAQACMAGRAYLYALGAGGERGVDHVLSMLSTGVTRTMALIGAGAVDDLTRDVIAER